MTVWLLTCQLHGHSPQADYAWLAAPISRRERDDAYLTSAPPSGTATTRSSATGVLVDELECAGHVTG